MRRAHTRRQARWAQRRDASSSASRLAPSPFTFEPLEPRILLSADAIALTTDQFDDFKAGVDAWVTWADLLDGLDDSFLDKNIPVINESIGELIDFSTFLTDNIKATLDAVGSLDSGDIATALQDALQLSDPSLAMATVVDASAGTELLFEVDFKYQVQHSFDLSLDALAVDADDSPLGITFDGTVDATATMFLEGDFSLGYDFAAVDPIGFFIDTGDDQFLVDQAGLTFGVEAGVVIDTTLNLGFVEGSVSGGMFSISGVEVGLALPDGGDDRTTIDELTADPPGLDDLTYDPSGVTVAMTLPVDVTVGTDGVGTTIISLTGLDGTTLFDDPDIGLVVDSTLPDFTSLSAGQVLSALEAIGAQLETLAGALDVVGGIPYIDTAISEVVDFLSMVDELVDQLTSDPEVSGTSMVVANLADDATFDVSLDGGSAVTVTLAKMDYGDATGLVTALNTALDAALDPGGTDPGQVVATILGGGELLLTATSAGNMDISGITAGSVAETALGLADGSGAFAFLFDTIDDLATLLDDSLLLESSLDAKYVASTMDAAAAIEFTLEMKAMFSKTTLFAFDESLDLGLATLDLGGSALATFDVDAGFKLVVGIELSKLDATDKLSDLNGGAGIQTNNDVAMPDLNIVVADGTAFAIDLDGLAADATVQDFIDLVQNATDDGMGPKVTVEVNSLSGTLTFTDTTTGQTYESQLDALDDGTGFVPAGSLQDLFDLLDAGNPDDVLTQAELQGILAAGSAYDGGDVNTTAELLALLDISGGSAGTDPDPDGMLELSEVKGQLSALWLAGPKFTIAMASGSPASLDLGLGLGTTAPDGKPTKIDTSSLISRIYINSDDTTVSATAKIAASDIELVAALGFLELEILGGTLDEIEVGMSFTLEDPNDSDRVFFEELDKAPIIVVPSIDLGDGLSLPLNFLDADNLGIDTESDLGSEVPTLVIAFDTDPTTTGSTVLDPMLMMGGDATFDVSLDGMMAVTVTLGAMDYADATSLVAALNTALDAALDPGGTNPGQVVASVTEDGELLLTATSANSMAISSSNMQAQEKLGLDGLFGFSAIVPDTSATLNSLPNLTELMTQFQNMTPAQMLSMVIDIATTLDEQFGIFDVNLPMLDISINDVLDFGSDGTGDTVNENSDLKTQLTELILYSPGADPSLVQTLFTNPSPEIQLALGVLAESGIDLLLTDAIDKLKKAVNQLPTNFNILTAQNPTDLILAAKAIGKVGQAVEGLDTTGNSPAEQDALAALTGELDTYFAALTAALPSGDALLEMIFETLGFELPTEGEGGTAATNALTVLGTIETGLDASESLLTAIDLSSVPDPDKTDLKTAIDGTLAEINTAQGLVDDAQALLMSAMDGLTPIDLINAFTLGKDLLEFVEKGKTAIEGLKVDISGIMTPTGTQVADALQVVIDSFGMEIADGLNLMVSALLGDFGGVMLVFEFDSDTNSMLLNIHYDLDILSAAGLPTEFDLDFGLPDELPFEIDAMIDGTLGLTGTLDIGFGLDLTDVSDPDFFLQVDSVVSLTATLELSGEVTASLILLDIGLGDTMSGDPATVLLTGTLGIGFTDPNMDGMIQEDEFTTAITPFADLTLDVDLPVYLNGSPLQYDDAADALKDVEIIAHVDILAVDLAGLDDFDVDISLPDAQDIANAIIAEFTSFSLVDLVGGLETVLLLLEDGVGSDFFMDLPIIGDDADELGSGLAAFRTAIFGDDSDPDSKGLDDLLTELQTSGETDFAAALEGLIQASLGQVMLPSLPDEFGVITMSPLLMSVDVNLTGVADILTTPINQLLTNANLEMTIDLVLNIHQEVVVPFDLGIDAFGFEVSSVGGVEVIFDAMLAFGIGLSTDKGAFLKFGEDGAPAADDITVTLDVGLTDNTIIKGDLFFLQVEATPWDEIDPDTGLGVDKAINSAATPDGKIQKGVGFTGGVGVNLFDGTTSNLGDLSFTPQFGANVEIDLLLSAASDLVPGLPSVYVLLDVDWDLLGPDGPTVALIDLTLDLGEFVVEVLSPVFLQLDPYIDPIKPVLDLINTKLPVVSDMAEFVGQAPVTFGTALNLLGTGFPSVQKFVDTIGYITTAIDIIEDIIDQIELGNEFLLNLGSMVFAGGSMDLTNPNEDLSQGTAVAPSVMPLDQLGSGGASDAGDPPADPMSFMKSLGDGSTPMSIDFPFLTDPAQMFALLLGETADLVRWTLPGLHAEFSKSYTYGIDIGPITLGPKLSAGFEIDVEFVVGFDTSGLGGSVGDFFGGFYVADVDSNGNDVDEVYVELSVSASLEFDAVIASAGIKGGVSAILTANLNDPDDDGKIYLDEFLDNAVKGPECIFDLSGKLVATLSYWWEVDLFFFSDSGGGDILPPLTLVDFSLECPDPVLAELVGDELHINIGPRADLRFDFDVEDDAETVFISQSGNVVTVTGFQWSESFTVTADTVIIADAGIGDDVITLDSSVTLDAYLKGGADNDIITGGSGDDTIEGGAGLDQAFGGLGNDTFRERVSDLVAGESFDGGGGIDTVELTGTTGADDLRVNAGPSAGELEISSYVGTVQSSVVATDIEVTDLRGIMGADTFTIDGSLGLETLTSVILDLGADTDADEVFLTLKDTADTVVMSSASEPLSADWTDSDANLVSFSFVNGASADELTIHALGGADSIDGSAVTINPLQRITLEGGDDNDTLVGTAGDDILKGGGDDDSITGDLGDDTIWGGAGQDEAYGGLGNDTFRERVGDLVAGESFDGGGGAYTDIVEILGTTGTDDLRVMREDSDELRFSSYVGGSESGYLLVKDTERTDLSGSDGADKFSIDGSQGLLGLASVNLDLGADGDVDEVLLTLKDSADTVVLSSDPSQVLAVWTDDLGTMVSFSLANGESADDLTIKAMGGADEVTVLGTYDGDTTIETNDGDDKVAVRDTTGSTWVNTGDDNDTINIGSIASPGDSGGGASTVDDIDGLLVIDGGSDFDVINVDDSGNTADKAGTLTATTLRGLELPGGIDYFDAEDFNLWLGTGNDGLFIVSTHAGTTQVWAGSGNATVNENDDTIAIESIDGATTIHGEGGNDAIHVNVTSPDVGSAGFHDDFKAAVDDMADPALFDALFQRTHLNGLDADLNLHGEGGSDYYTLHLAGEGTALVNVHDDGAPDDGVDTLLINGADDIEGVGNQPDDTFLLRRDLVVLLNTPMPDGSFGNVERVNYDENINARLIIQGLGGNDTIVADDNSAITTLDGGDGNDLIQIGQVFGMPRDDASVPVLEDQFVTKAVIIGVITDPVTGQIIFDPSTFNPVTDPPLSGDTIDAINAAILHQASLPTPESLDGIAYVSNGVTYSTTVFGGDGDDTFNVYHNKGTLRLEGEDGDDAFVVRAFVTFSADGAEVASQGEAEVLGGAGADTIQYAINAPVNIDGGAGIDTVLVLGTPFGDAFVVSSEGIFGAGLNVKFTNVESASLDALEGDDSIYVLGTQSGLVTTVIGGLGSDTIDVMGDVLATIVSDDLLGASGQIDHDASSSDASYDGVGVNSVAAQILSADAGSLVNISNTGAPLVVTENGTKSSYFISLVDPTSITAPVYLTVSAGVASSEDQSNGGAGVLVSVNGGPFTNAVVLTFDGATADDVFEIEVMAVDDAGAEGPRVALISHGIVSADPEFSGVALIDTLVNVVDNDLAGLDIQHLQPSGGSYVLDTSTEVLEGTGGFSDVYSVALTGAPDVGETVTVMLGTDGQVTAQSMSGDDFLVFTSANWMTAQNVFVSAVDDTDLEGIDLSTILHKVSSDGLAYGSGVDDVGLDVVVYDDEASGVIVRETGGSTLVSKDGSDVDSYWIRLTSQPTDDVTLTLTTDTQTFLSYDGFVTIDETGMDDVFKYDLVFTDSSWSTWIEIEVTGNPTPVATSGGGGTTLEFATKDQNLDQISGPLIVEGGIGQGLVQALLPPILLPGEIDDPSGQVLTPTAESDDIDVLSVFHADNVAAESGVLSYRLLDGAGDPLANPGLSLTGLGMGGDLQLATSTGGPEVTYGGGITLNGFEVVEVMLGSGDETLTIHDTGDRDEKDLNVTDDPATIMLIHGGGGNDTVIVTDRGEGALVIYGDTSEDGARYGLGAEGGEPAGGTATSFNNPGDDIIDASQMADQGDAFVGIVVYGGPGNDRITGSQGDDHLAGGEGGDTIDGQAGADHVYGDSHFNIDANLFAQDQIERFDATDPDELALIDAMFTVVSAGAGANDSLVGDAGDDILFGDHGVIDQVAGTRRIESTGEVIALRTVSMTEGGNDTITGDAGVDRIFGGALDDLIDAGTGNDIVFGDGGEVIQPNGVPVTIRSTDTSIGGDDAISGGLGADLILGGTGADLIRGDDALPDTEESLGGGSSLGSSSDGSDTLTGGAGIDAAAGDPLETGASNGDVILGDSGEILLVAGVVTEIRTTSPAIGGSDTIEGNLGGDTILGGAAGDDIAGNEDADVILGDNGEVLQPGGVPETIQSTDTSVGGDDTITGDAGADMILGGVGADSIAGKDDPDIIVGDSGQILLVGGAVTEIRTTSPSIGGSDTISGDLGDDTILGGAAGDDITGDAGTDVILGDNGEVLITGQLIQTLDPNDGGADTISAGSGDDIVLGGTSTDTIAGDSGNDLIFGDHGLVDFTLPPAENFTAIFTGAADGGDDDVIHGNDAADTALGAGVTDEDTILGQQGDDQLFGGLGDDDLIGGHNVAGGIDELGAVGSGNDTMDGGAGDDVLAGDNAIVIRRADALSPLMKVLVGETLYDMNLLPDVTGAVQLNPLGVIGRDITLLDHDSAAAFFGGGGQFFGDDSIAGGAHDDLVFGQLGDDVIQGDGSTTNDVLADGFSTVGADDGDDYIEGNGGDDLIFGNLGQDDIIGGSSSLFGLTLQSQRIDGADVLFGGAGTDIAYGTFGDLSAEGHALDADVLIGDNANVFRIVGVNGVDSGAFLSFNYDDYSAVESIVVRAYDLLDDYEEAGDVAGGVLANPVESGLGGADVIHGEAGDDTIAGMLGADVMFGEGQDDNVIGGEGTDWMSGGTGQDGMLGDGGHVFTSRNGVAEPLFGIAATSEQFISLPGNQGSTTLNVNGKLSKSVDLEPFDIGDDDTLYGGLGDDSLHGGAGIDGLSGAEALPGFYADPASTPVIVYDASELVNDFVDFDDFDPAQKILGFGLNFAAFEGDPGNPIDDGDDVLFGDLGNDWLVGGTGSDHLYGGYGNDILNLDDNLDTDGGDNTSPDAEPYSGPDTALGGAGRDTLLGNSKDDRMFDWVGEFNAYVVPFNPFGKAAISRNLSPAIEQFFYDISESDGADQTRVGPGLGTEARNGEPFGELGLVTQEDDDWQAQTGAPDDPQQGGGGTDSPGEDPGEDPMPYNIVGGVYVVEYLDPPNTGTPPIIDVGGGLVMGVRGDAGVGGETGLGGMESATTSESDSSARIEGLEIFGTADDTDTDVIVVDAADTETDATSTRDFGLDDLTISLATTGELEDTSTETEVVVTTTETEERSEWTIEEADETPLVRTDSDPLLVWRRESVTDREVMTVDPLSL
jgi:Ca2+-binding RTX toxin-like protein